MKKTKVVLAMVCAVLLVAASVMGTLAYLTSADKVVNTFTVGKVTFGGDGHTAGLDEAKVNTDGKPVDNDDKVVELVKAPRVQKNEYKLQPGHTYTKDPTIHINSESEDCYLFVKVENGIADIEAKNDKDVKTIAAQMEENGWYSLGGDKKDIYVYGTKGTDNTITPKVYTVKADGKNDVPVFAKFKVDGSVTNETLQTYKSTTKKETQIVITAYGVQADGFEGKTATEIWTAAGFATMTVKPSTETEAPSTEPVESEKDAE